jgi:hypothetical protein
LDEDFGEGFGDLFEGALDSFVFALVEDVDEVFDGFAAAVELFLPGRQLVSLFREIFVLFEGFLVDVGVFLQGFVDFGKTLGSLNSSLASSSEDILQFADNVPSRETTSRTSTMPRQVECRAP